ncbi:WD40 repeat domain-containing protein [Streptomyces kronopolitis]
MATVIPEPDIAAWPHVEGVSGRQQLFDWVVDVNGDRPRLCLVRGGQGTGKSRLLAWFLAGAAAAGHPRTTVHATIPADGLTADTFAWDLGRQLGYGPLPLDRLLNQAAADQRSTLLLVPDLHRAGRGSADLAQADPTTLVTAFLEPLLALPHIRAVIEVGDSGLLAEHSAEVIEGHPDATHELPGAATTSFADLIAAVPHTAAGRPDWAQAPDALRRRVLDQALYEAGGQPTAEVERLLADPGFLVYGSAHAITAAMDDARLRLPDGARRIWRRAAPQLTATEHGHMERAALLHTAALGDNDRLAAYLQPLAEQHHWTATWAQHDTPAAAHCQLSGDNGQLLVSDPLGRLQLHDLETSQHTSIPSALPVRPAAIVGTGSDALLVLDDDGVPHAVTSDEDGAAATLLGHIAAHHTHALPSTEVSRPTALGSCSRSHLISVGDTSGAVHLWSLTTYSPTPRSHRLHTVPITAVTCLPLGDDGPTLVFSAAFDGSIRMWEASQEPMEAPVDQRPAVVTALATADTDIGPLLAAAWNDGEVHLWHLTSGTARTVPLLYRCNALSLTPSGHLTVSGPDGSHTIRLSLHQLWP